MFVHNNFGGLIGAIELTDVERELLVMVNRELKAYINNLEHIKYVGLFVSHLCHLLVIISSFHCLVIIIVFAPFYVNPKAFNHTLGYSLMVTPQLLLLNGYSSIVTPQWSLLNC